MKEYRIIAGIDQSLNSTGICIFDSLTKEVLFSKAIVLNGKKGTPKLFGIDRLAYIRDQVMEILLEYKVEFISLEGYSYGSVGRSLFELGEVGGAVRILSYDLGIRFEVVPPKTLKKYITGNGNADKEIMKNSVESKYKKTFETSDETDAYGLAVMTAELGPDSIHDYCYEIKKEKVKKKK